MEGRWWYEARKEVARPSGRVKAESWWPHPMSAARPPFCVPRPSHAGLVSSRGSAKGADRTWGWSCRRGSGQGRPEHYSPKACGRLSIRRRQLGFVWCSAGSAGAVGRFD
ncbi:histone-lysine N-methyltransferase SUVR5-like [Dorcoceras hygrometricum]|uniref:Histone-lysine N-methyltransferase SUVR5-like n=1 Tax=Dorcoceras hygrometricum TaxID=472368 RepID=A0A2Z7BMK1_9LAMI|nr:histone-lysine N-methyltransferase SUVR5-like [Dorcoceras hygrometricum]